MTDSPLSFFHERLELLREKVRLGIHVQCLVNLTACCEQIHAAYIWLKMNNAPLSRQFEELLHEAQDAISDIRKYQFLNHINYSAMNAIAFGQTAKEHFESIMPSNISNGWEKFVVTDGTDCLIVRSDYRPRAGEIVFHCSIKNGIPCAELYRTGKPSPTPVSAN